METCEWKLDIEEANAWVSACGHSFWFETGTPEENEMKFCPYCGRNLTIRAADVCQSSPLGTHRFINDDAGEICIMCGTRR